ncbi:COPII coat assembly protein SEC16 isoform X1 [Musa acuminata AAA Group]|uniref:COPII coat assembly protein SEC16 isoform X1 n=1 Tax=Musa acuminata AAA Group TaxID=214697 RepID=UPI0031CDBF67
MEAKSVSPAGDCAFSAGGYQRVSPDVLPLGNGRKPILRTSNEDDADHSSRNANHSPSEGKSTRARSVSVSAGPSPSRDHQFPRILAPSDSPTSAAATHSERQPPPSASPKSQSRQPHDAVNGVGSDVILQWGHNKRSRRPRASGDETSAHLRQLLKIPRRSPASSSAAMPPPPCGGSCPRAGHLRTSVPVRDAKKGVEDQSGGPARSEKRSPPALPDKAPRAAADAPVNPSGPKQPPADQESAPVAIAEKLSLDRLEWPKIYLSLSRKEKEDDFLAMKGTKLPQRPKKRAKNIDRTLQYCFPGMWLSDLTRGRYEVREKKCAKKTSYGMHDRNQFHYLPSREGRRRGLKGMESVDSDSE